MELNRLQVTVVHGGDNAMRARGAAAHQLAEFENTEALNILHTQVDRVIIFSGAKTAGVDRPSEARQMYEVFRKRMDVFAQWGRIPGVQFVSDSDDETSALMKIGEQEVRILFEEDSVDTEDNASRSVQIIDQLFKEGNYHDLRIVPMSSEFHIPRIQEAFERYTPKPFHSSIRPRSAEGELDRMGGKYAKYGHLKREKVPVKTRVLEVIVRNISRYPLGRDVIRGKTRTRVSS